MRWVMSRDTALSGRQPYAVQAVDLKDSELSAYLQKVLSVVMATSEDPTLSSSPERYIENLFAGKLGDFNYRVILTIQNQALLIGLVKKEGFHITTLGVSEAFRGQGMGKALLISAAEQLRKQGIQKMYLNVHSDNSAAIALYKHMGFVTEEI